MASGKLGNCRFPEEGKKESEEVMGPDSTSCRNFKRFLGDLNPEGQTVRVGCGVRTAGRFDASFI